MRQWACCTDGGCGLFLQPACACSALRVVVQEGCARMRTEGWLDGWICWMAGWPIYLRQ